MKTFWASAIACTALFTGVITESVSAIGIYTVLYDGTGLPSDDGASAYLQMNAIDGVGNVVSPFVGESPSGGNVTVNTRGDYNDPDTGATISPAEYASYSNYNVSTGNYLNDFVADTLSLTDGFRITFTVKLDTIFNDLSERASFSIVAITNSVDFKGIEIGFRSGEVFAQSSDFGTSSERSTNIAPEVGGTYILTVGRGKYLLNSSDNLETPIIQGDLKVYDFSQVSNSPELPPGFNPYQTNSFISLGDTTSQAAGTFTLGEVNLDLTPVPFEFSPTYGLLALGGIAAFKHWQNKQKK